MTRVSCVSLWFGMIILACSGLYPTSYRVETLQRQLQKNNRMIEAEQQNIHVLKAEWVYLTNPVRLAAAAQKYLKLQPTSLKQVASLNRLKDVLPVIEEAPSSSRVAEAAPKEAPLRVASATSRNGTHASFANDGQHINTRMILESDAAARSDRASLTILDDGTTP